MYRLVVVHFLDWSEQLGESGREQEQLIQQVLVIQQPLELRKMRFWRISRIVVNIEDDVRWKEKVCSDFHLNFNQIGKKKKL